jgi:hypothetical protein
MLRRVTWLLFSLPIVLVAQGSRADETANAGLFRKRVFSILRDNCFSCHGTLKTSGLDLRSHATLITGGSHGQILTPGRATASRMFRYVAGLEKIQMPPAKKLTPAQIADIKAWINGGAAWPTDVKAVDERPWAFRPMTRPAVPTIRNPQSAIRNPIDAFILAKLEQKGLRPSPRADKRTLIRRATLDLLGLPPTPAEVEAFVNDKSPDAWEKLIDRLLASPHYGERWARHWLDLARYAESEGFKSDEMRPNAWRYRDYVIQSLNTDKPYDRFLKDQIAGDELYPGDMDARVATGFLRHWADESNARNLWQRRQEILDDITDVTASSVLGLTAGCARCHDHKYDPIPQADYYRLQAFFAAVRPRDDIPLLPADKLNEHAQRQKAWEEKTADIRAEIAQIEALARNELYHVSFDKFPKEIQQAIEKPAKERTALDWFLFHKAEPYFKVSDKDIEGKLKGETKTRWQELQKRLVEYKPLKPDLLPVAQGVTDLGPEAPKTYTLAVGLYNRPVREVEPGFLSIIDPATPSLKPAECCEDGTPAATTGRRSVLANWIASKDNPLTARVMVNRLWHYHFGRGIVATPSDFGAQGEKPSHPDLLDWLATEFVRRGWSLKQMHRLIMTSGTYQQASANNTAAARVDADNRLLWRYRRHRLEGEAVRDCILSVSGELNPKMGGPSVMPELPAEVTTRGYWKETADPRERSRRSVYVFVKRNLRYPLFQAFDMPDTHESCSRREVTTTPLQSLMLMNDELVLRSAQAFASRVAKEAGPDVGQQVDLAYRLAFGRTPGTEEKRAAVAFIQRQRDLFKAPLPSASVDILAPGADDGEAADVLAPLAKGGPVDPIAAALADFCHVLLNANEFVYVE